nr:hypothetical protein [Pandoravirus belohorizontensis]
MASTGNLIRSAAAAASTPIALCGIAAASSAWIRTRRRDDSVGGTLCVMSHAACAVVGFGAAMALCRERSTSMLACAAASIAIEEAMATLLTRGPLGVLGCLVTILGRVAASISAAAVVWCVWNLCFVGPASIISPPLLALRASHGVLVWVVAIAPAVYPFAILCYRSLRALAAVAS